MQCTASFSARRCVDFFAGGGGGSFFSFVQQKEWPFPCCLLFMVVLRSEVYFSALQVSCVKVPIVITFRRVDRIHRNQFGIKGLNSGNACYHSVC
jgi:hypothetical protein